MGDDVLGKRLIVDQQHGTNGGVVFDHCKLRRFQGWRNNVLRDNSGLILH
jgi:hypothetical protein